ncbi:unnamed protein product [Chrysoparadoxa australica]
MPKEWWDHKREKKRSKKRKRAEDKVKHGQGPDEKQQEEQDEESPLEVLVHEGAMLLLDAAEDVLYAADRDKDGNRVRVGIRCDGKVQLDMKADERSKPDVQTSYPFEVTDEDHCETPLAAYMHIQPLLSSLAQRLGKEDQDLIVYDPYYCRGTMVERMESLGFSTVINSKQDFYADIDRGCVPEHDVLVTNPPFSGSHIERLMKFCAEQNQSRPFFLLLPNYCYCHDWHAEAAQQTDLFYLTPPARYTFERPKRCNNSPFNCFWNISMGISTACQGLKQEALTRLRAQQAELPEDSLCAVATSTRKLPYRFMDSSDPVRKKQRSRMRRRSKGRGAISHSS